MTGERFASPRDRFYLEQFRPEINRIRIRQPQHNIQKKLIRPARKRKTKFVAYVDAIGHLDGKPAFCSNGRRPVLATPSSPKG